MLLQNSLTNSKISKQPCRKLRGIDRHSRTACADLRAGSGNDNTLQATGPQPQKIQLLFKRRMMIQKIEISSEVLTQEVGGETVILDLKSESYFGLDEVGTRIWQLLQEQKDIQSIAEIMLNEYDVEEKQLGKDIQNLLTQLNKAGIVTLDSD